MSDTTLAWTVFAAGMFLVWTVVYLKTGSFRKSMIASLLVGKSFAIAYKLGGLDRTVATLYLVNRATGLVKPIEITACEILFLAFLASLIAVIYAPVLQKHLPRELRRSLEELRA